jgi:peptidoglycan/xylan/chitin deacetylase (PgdA/CDA1 family)
MQYAGRIKRQFTGSAVILLYHRVAEPDEDPQLLSVTPRNFSEQMSILRSFGKPIPLTELVTMGRNRGLPKGGIVVTFDDGYADNLHNAKPALSRFEIPATVFVTAGQVGSTEEYWWDELERLLLEQPRLPDVLDLRTDKVKLQWRLGNSRTFDAKDRAKHHGWNVRLHPPTERHALYLTLHKLVRPLEQGAREQILNELRHWAGCGPDGRKTHWPATAQEIRELASGGLVEVGAHTMTHPVLSQIARDIQCTEIEQSKVSLERVLGRPVMNFAYPFGGVADYAPESVAAVRRAGFESACSNYPGLVEPKSDWFQLPRVLVGNWNGDQFARHLRKWLAYG